MSIETDIEVNWNGTVDNTNKIGLSKPFTELPSDVWADDSAFITAYVNPAAKFTKVSDGYPTCPVKSNDCPWYLTGGIGYSNINHNSDSIYLRSSIICVPDDFVYNTWNGNQGGRIRDNINNFRIVTSMSTEKNGVDVSLTVQDGTVVGAQYVLKETLTGSSSNGGITIGAGTYILMVVDIYTVDGNYYLNIPYSLPGFVYDTNNGDGVMGMWAYDSTVNKMFSLSPQIFPTDDGRISIVGGAVYNVNTWNRHELPAVEGDENLLFCASYIPWNWYLSLSGNVHYHLLAVSRFGLKFKYNNDNYKPIIAQGVVTGYTTDMTVPSDFDNWTDISGHNISPAPPVPPSPTGDDIDKQHFGGGTALGGAENLWLLTTAQMTSLHNAISSCDVPNFEPLNSVISVMGLAIPPTYPLGTDIATLININIRKSDGTLWSTHTEGHICDKQTASFGFTNNIKIKRKYNNFLDYPPYSSHEIFLPLCGWLPLPAYAVGRNLTVYYVHDINTCSVRGLVFCEGSLIGEKYGTMGANIPFSSSGHSLYVGGLITGGVQTLADFATAVSSKGPIALMSAIQGVAEGANTLLASNQNRTSVIGQNQDRTSFADGQYIRIKSTYPDVKIEENFGHTFGFVCNKKGQLKDFKGFTTCENPHVYGFSCTSEEKDEIERLLKAGIIINIPEE